MAGLNIAGGDIRVDEVDVTDPSARELVDALASDTPGHAAAVREAIMQPIRFDTNPIWSVMGRALIPDGLRSILERRSTSRPERIVIVPDGPLTLIPWAAFPVGGAPLVSRAVLQLVPALEMLTIAEPAPQVHEGRSSRHLDTRLGGHADTARELSLRMNMQFTETRDEFVAALDTERFGGAYLLTHGLGIGIDQRTMFSDGQPLSAARALAHTWPVPWTVFASCLVGRVDRIVGREPLGLAISCMLGGSHTVVASVLEVTSADALNGRRRPTGAPAICPRVSAAIAAGEHPADALRAAQLEYLDGSRLVTVADCLGLMCLSTLRPPLPSEWR